MTALLEVDGIATSYGRSQVLFGMSLDVGIGEVVTLMGRNGMGKTTTIRSILGLTRAAAGSIRMAGVELRGQPCFKVARHGIGIVPEGRQVFPNLSVLEHLLVAATNRTGRHDPWTPQKVFGLFPRLRERQGNLGNQLSGGEQQMLAIGRALMTNPRLLILDEATEGLAPLIREEIWTCLAALKSDGQSILVVDKNLDALIRIADRHFIIEKGRVAWTGTSAELLAAPEMQQRYLGV
ncbi:MAG: putative branched-chain amino acid transporter, ATP-binding protein [Rhodospirillales bacterium]|jgi:branched-chain amino acid transport system ATP-binding protein|nr:putative branched-chain amino acid transporter, ATP-binding protein [Rhodospirillales bacterium]